MICLLTAIMLFTGAVSVPVSAKTDTFCKGQTLDATDDVAFAGSENINGVKSFGVTFNNMGATVSEENNKNIRKL